MADDATWPPKDPGGAFTAEERIRWKVGKEIMLDPAEGRALLAEADAARARIADLEGKLARLKAPDLGTAPNPFVDAAELVVLRRLRKIEGDE